MSHNPSNSTIIYQARLNKIIFFWPLLLLLASGLLAHQLPQLTQPSLILAGVAVLWCGITWVNYHFSSLTIKPKHIIFRTGMLVRQTLDIPMDKIESIDIRQSLLGSLLKYGSLVVTGTGGTRHLISYINDPLRCRRHVEVLIHKQS
ncbi:MAG: PH domain-containing protein [Legionellaceae bacterium]|nr:PH domain-containing protein [Legionellaceae bacterium]